MTSVHCWDPLDQTSKCQVCISTPDQSITCEGINMSKCLSVCGGDTGTKCTNDNKATCVAIDECIWDSDGL